MKIVEEPAASELSSSLLQRYFDELAERFVEGTPKRPPQLAEPGQMSPPHGVFLVAYVEGRACGCGGLRRLDDSTAEVKHMWIDPEVRGRGVGRGLLSGLERAAVELGYSTVRLDTSSRLTEAIGLYRSSGYADIDTYNDNPYAAHWFEKKLA